MRKDIGDLLSQRNLDAAVVMGSTSQSPFIYYLTGGIDLENVIILLRPGHTGILIHSPIDRDGAAATGLQSVPTNHWDMAGIRRQAQGDLLAAQVELLRQVFAEFAIRGRVGFYGHGEIGMYHALLSSLDRLLPDLQVVAEYGKDPFTVARSTKDEAEIAAMIRVAQETHDVVAEVADMLAGRPVSDNHLVGPGGEPLTVGHVKRFVRAAVARRGLEEPVEHIFSIGSDAGVPHNRGNEASVLELGKSIIFDIFPRPVGGGYYHDITRTWCLGYAPPEVERAFEETRAVFDLAAAALEVGRATRDYQILTCEFYESHGHATLLSDPKTNQGYVHSLGHGLGLEVHEAPSFSHLAGNEDTVLERGAVFTIEPGLYYPEHGFGVRIEDTYYCDEQGRFHTLCGTPFARDLVLPVRK